MVLRQELENQLSSMKKELQQTKENAEQWMRENVERFEEDLKKAKAKVYPLALLPYSFRIMKILFRLRTGKKKKNKNMKKV